MVCSSEVWCDILAQRDRAKDQMIFQEPMRKMNVGCMITMNDHVGGGMGGGGIKDVMGAREINRCGHSKIKGM